MTPRSRDPKPSASRKWKKYNKRKGNGNVERQEAQQLWNKQQRQSRRWLAHSQRAHTNGSIPRQVASELLQLMKAKNSGEVSAMLGRTLEPRTRELWEKLKREREAAKAACNRFYAPDWWLGGGEGGGEDAVEGGEGGGEEGGQEAEGRGGDEDVDMDDSVGRGGDSGSWTTDLTFRN